MPARTTALEHGIVAIDTEYAWPGQNASHLLIEQGRAAFVDTGVNSSVPLLLEALADEDLDVDAVDYVFLTHVHLDHAGGAGLLLDALPNARCIVHPRGAPHIIDPGRLVAGTKAVYGADRTREIYGDIRPIDAARVIEPADGERFSLAGRELEAFYTEGHARHHYCLADPASAGVFTGDSFGVSYRAFDTAAGEFIFPTTTPVHFDPVEAHRSVDKILARDPAQAYLTHYSRVANLDRLAADLHAGIEALVAMARAVAADPARSPKLRAAMLDYFTARLAGHGFDADRATIGSMLELDIELNSQGLEVWLDRTAED